MHVCQFRQEQAAQSDPKGRRGNTRKINHFLDPNWSKFMIVSYLLGTHKKNVWGIVNTLYSLLPPKFPYFYANAVKKLDGSVVVGKWFHTS